ncbi:phosphatase PAP2 family protein [Mycolicibacterium duvalii]|nr:phosphatase PAP2 family protein [Mycolicibacterium duvalii]MCV7369009.1 phosphatase PAP2 family protein [Mycolicibacterium duvalii]PEG44536.1 phosphatase PAP2 family protein [Mycolicibacterium duvalii]
MWAGSAGEWSWLVALDTAALDAMHDIGAAHPAWVTAWDVFCTVFGPTVFRVVTLVVIVVALTRRNLPLALFLVVSVELNGLITEIAKYLADRPRPDTAMVTAHSTAFPSGHALGVLVSVCALLVVVLPLVSDRLGRLLAAAGIVLVVTVGLGRVVLNVHHPSDVIAGWALGYAYFLLCLRLVPPRRRLMEADETPAVPDTAR